MVSVTSSCLPGKLLPQFTGIQLYEKLSPGISSIGNISPWIPGDFLCVPITQLLCSLIRNSFEGKIDFLKKRQILPFFLNLCSSSSILLPLAGLID